MCSPGDKWLCSTGCISAIPRDYWRRCFVDMACCRLGHVPLAQNALRAKGAQSMRVAPAQSLRTEEVSSFVKAINTCLEFVRGE